MVTLKNKQRRMRTFNLDAPFFVKRHGETLYGRPETLTLLALERREGVPDAVLACTEVKAAIGQGNLRVYKQAESAIEPKAEAKSPTIEPELVPEPASDPEPKPEPMAEAPKPIADSKPDPVAETPKPEPKPAPRKTSFRRGSQKKD